MADYIVNIDEENKETQTVLAKKLIRCKDCKYYNGDNYYCDFEMIAKDNGYCYRAERKEE